MNTLAKIDFYKPSGKWYAGGEVDMEYVKPWDDLDEILAVIKKNQRIMNSYWGYHIVLSDTPENYRDPNYMQTWNRLITSDQVDAN